MANQERSEDFQYIIRVSNTDLDGEKKIVDSLRKIKGVSFMFANALCTVAGVEKNALTGELQEPQIKAIQKAVDNPGEAGVPSWLVNRRRDYETGEDKHVIVNDLIIAHEDDMKRLKKIKTYRGLRLQAGLPVRGQRTKSNFRSNKGKKR
jgi:small subunit ribosomal protein S13